MDAFRFSPELFEIRTKVQEALSEAGFEWLSHYSAVDPIHDLYGIEVCGIHDEQDAIAIQKLLCEMFPTWFAGCCLCYKDYGAEPGFKAKVTREKPKCSDDEQWETAGERPSRIGPRTCILWGIGSVAFAMFCLVVSLNGPPDEALWSRALLIVPQTVLGLVILTSALIIKGIEIRWRSTTPKELRFLWKQQSLLFDEHFSRWRHFTVACWLVSAILFLYPAFHFWLGL